MKKIADVAMILMFLMLLVLTVMLVLAAFHHHLAAIRTSQDAIKDLNRNLSRNDGEDCATDRASLLRRDYLARLKQAQTELFDTNTVSFLFQVLLLCLITVGAYLLERTNANVKTAEALTDSAVKRISRVKPFLKSVSAGQLLSFYYASLYQIITMLPGTSPSQQMNVWPIMRDSFKMIKNCLIEMRAQQHGIEHSLYHSIILDAAGKTNRLLQKLASSPEDGKVSAAAEFIPVSEECYDLLTTARFPEKYEQLLNEIEQSSPA